MSDTEAPRLGVPPPPPRSEGQRRYPAYEVALDARIRDALCILRLQ